MKAAAAALAGSGSLSACTYSMQLCMTCRKISVSMSGVDRLVLQATSSLQHPKGKRRAEGGGGD
jgi:hypothetical protein